MRQRLLPFGLYPSSRRRTARNGSGKPVFYRLALLVALALGSALKAQDADPNTPPEPSSATWSQSGKGLVPVRNGRVDAVRATLDLNFPLGPNLPGRIPAGFSWYLKGWRGNQTHMR